ncbi:hypothetical protein M758_6G209200 [Ceratodon purpureus]|nr:hypothetical protein M758_6G209200 [Ceratodon purpureus]
MNGAVECKTCGSKVRPISKAYDRQHSVNQPKWRALNVLLVLGDCTLIALQARKQRPGERSLLSPSVILTAARKNYLLTVPAFFYAINNYLKFIMRLYFHPATVKMLSNLKVLVIVLLLKAVMKRRFYQTQWEALTLLLIGISVNQLHTTQAGTTALAIPIAIVAYSYTLAFVTVLSLESVYNEYALKSQFDTSVHLQNLLLYAYGAMFNFFAMMISAIYQGGAGFNILEGHSKATMFLIINNAAQGILSSFFYKYADTILKKYSSTVATIFTGLASAALFGHALTINFILAVTIVFISMHQFFSSISKPQVEEASYTHLELLGRKLDKKDSSLDDLASVTHQEGSHTISVRSEREPLLPK